MKIEIIIKWYDAWIGLFFDKKKKWLYIFLIPFVGIVLKFKNSFISTKFKTIDVSSDKFEELWKQPFGSVYIAHWIKYKKGDTVVFIYKDKVIKGEIHNLSRLVINDIRQEDGIATIHCLIKSHLQ